MSELSDSQYAKAQLSHTEVSATMTGLLQAFHLPSPPRGTGDLRVVSQIKPSLLLKLLVPNFFLQQHEF